MKKFTIAGAVLISLGLGVSSAHAKSVDVTGTASCTTGVTAKIKAGPRDPRQIRTSVQIDEAGTARQVWSITLLDGAQTRSATLTTAGTSNSIDREFGTADSVGADTVTFTATRVGASCSGSVTVG